MKYGIGLDVGIESVGFSVLELDSFDQPFRIEKLGSRIFNKAENPKDGSSLAAPRREARSSRRRLRRHRHRLERIRGLIVSSGILSKENLNSLYDGRLTDVYELRTRALDELITPEEFARIMIHLAQRRGYKSNKRSSGSDDGKLLSAVSENLKRCEKHGYRTVGEMFYRDNAFAEFKRNKAECYIATVDRASVESETKLIFESQRRFGNPHANAVTEAAYLAILLSQRSFADGPACGPYSGNQIERMRGYCTFEEGETRAAKASYSFQLFNLWQHINHIRVVDEGNSRALNDDERKIVFDLAHQKNEPSFYEIRKLLGLPSESKFKNVTYTQNNIVESEKKSKIKDLLIYRTVRKCIEAVSKEAFSKLSHTHLDAIGEALSKNQPEEKILADLTSVGIDKDVIAALLELPNFSKYGHLSVKACKKILPFLEKGMTYDKACSMAGYSFNSSSKKHQKYLPPLPSSDNEITSPVVKRSISQAIKVINAII